MKWFGSQELLAGERRIYPSPLNHVAVHDHQNGGDLLRRRLAASGIAAEVTQHLVLTGGGSQLTGLPELTANMFGRPVRLGRPRSLRGLPSAAASPDFAVGVGLLLNWAKGDDRQSGAAEQRFLRTGTGYFAKVGEWIRDNF